MAKIIIASKCAEQLNELDKAVDALNQQRIRLLFEMLAIKISETDLLRVLEWTLIILTVRDKQMAVQLNKLCAYVPNLKFVVDAGQSLFTLVQGSKSRRIWKER